MGTFRQDWKMYGLTLGSVTVIPCYYDVVKFINKRIMRFVWRLKKIHVGIAILRWRSIFDNTINI